MTRSQLSCLFAEMLHILLVSNLLLLSELKASDLKHPALTQAAEEGPALVT